MVPVTQIGSHMAPGRFSAMEIDGKDETYGLGLTSVSSGVSRLGSSLGYQSSRHTVMSSHGQLVTGQLVTQASRHTVNSSQDST